MRINAKEKQEQDVAATKRSMMPRRLSNVPGYILLKSLFQRAAAWRRWRDWALYLVLAVAAFLRFFRLQTTEFDTDQANLFQLARDTLTHGLIPLSSNQASIGTLHAPFFIYFLLPAAVLSSNPLGGAILVSLSTTAAAGLTYLFTRRYFGRLPALVAGLLYATANGPLKYGRNIWQPDILTFFLLLFLFAIFRGAVARKGGWFAPAIALLAILYQLDPSSIVGPGILVLLVLLLAPTTLRWRDMLLAACALLVLFSPYILLQLLTNFADMKGLLAFSQLPARTDTQAFQLYWGLFSPFNGLLTPWMNLLGYGLDALFMLGVLTAVPRVWQSHKQEVKPAVIERGWSRYVQYWQRLRLDPARVAFLLLLAWQIFPFADLVHHAIDLHTQYLLIFLPGPFILIGVALDECVGIVSRWQPNFRMGARIGVLFLSALLVIGQFIGTTASLFETSDGHVANQAIQTTPYRNNLDSLWNAVHQADTLAQQRHSNRLFISIDGDLQSSMMYLSTTTQTPAAVFGYDDCLTLPAPGTGPAVYLVGPYASHIDSLLQQFASATLIAQPPRIGGNPFRLYLVTPKAATSAPDSRVITTPNATLAVARWRIARTALAAPRTLYTYQFTLSTAAPSSAVSTTCTTTALQTNDQLLVAFPLSSSATATTAVTRSSIQGTAFDTAPVTYHVGALRFTVFLTQAVNRPFANDLRWVA